MLRAEPAIIAMAASMLAALRSGIFCSAIFRICSPVIVATFVLLGTPEPLSMPHAFLIRTAAGGVFVTLNSLQTVQPGSGYWLLATRPATLTYPQ